MLPTRARRFRVWLKDANEASVLRYRYDPDGVCMLYFCNGGAVLWYAAIDENDLPETVMFFKSHGVRCEESDPKWKPRLQPPSYGG